MSAQPGSRGIARASPRLVMVMVMVVMVVRGSGGQEVRGPSDVPLPQAIANWGRIGQPWRARPERGAKHRNATRLPPRPRGAQPGCNPMGEVARSILRVTGARPAARRRAAAIASGPQWGDIGRTDGPSPP